MDIHRLKSLRPVVFVMECQAGHIDTISAEAARVALHLGVTVEFEFNGRKMFANPRTLRESVSEKASDA